MLLSVISCSHIAAGGLANESVSLLGHRRPEIRVARRSGGGGSLGGRPRRPPWPACGDRPGPGGSRRAGSSRGARGRRPGPRGPSAAPERRGDRAIHAPR